MNHLTRFLLVALMIVPVGAVANPVPTTMGSNLTAYNPGSGALNNNAWANATNSRSSMEVAAPTADFGNCNSLILRCAQPKCANGGCVSMDVARPIVNGCVESNDVCKTHGKDLVDYIAGQLVADSVAAANAASASSAAADAAAAANAQQMQMMQNQMAQMQADMAAQNAQQMAQMQAALEEQKQLTANAVAQAEAAARARAEEEARAKEAAQSSGATPSDAAMEAAAKGISQDVILREQVGGQIMTTIENAEAQLKTLKTTMDAVFEYAGCDSMGNNCDGPKRVAQFKKMANQFFTPYENVVDEVYDALVMAMTVGVDVTDIMMLLNDSCNMWGEYWCGPGQEPTYSASTCVNGYSQPVRYEKSQKPVGARVCADNANQYCVGPILSQKCTIGGRIPESNNGCRLIRTYKPGDNDVARQMLYGEEEGGMNGDTMRVACASDALLTAPIFAKKAKNTMIDVDTLQRIITQNEGKVGRNRKSTDSGDVTKYCAVDENMYTDLQEYTARRTLPEKRLCINESRLDRTFNDLVPLINVDGESQMERAKAECGKKYVNAYFSEITGACICSVEYVDPTKKTEIKKDGNGRQYCNVNETIAKIQSAHRRKCSGFGGEWTNNNSDTEQYGSCDCKGKYDDNDISDQDACKDWFENRVVVSPSDLASLASSNSGSSTSSGLIPKKTYEKDENLTRQLNNILSQTQDNESSLKWANKKLSCFKECNPGKAWDYNSKYKEILNKALDAESNFVVTRDSCDCDEE